MSSDENFDIESIHIDIRKEKKFNILHPSCIILGKLQVNGLSSNKIYFCRNNLETLKNDESIKIASGSSDYTIKLWSLAPTISSSDFCQSTLYGHTDMILFIIYIKSRNQLISSSYDCTLKQWDLNTNSCLNTFHGHTDYVNCICQMDERGDKIASGSSDWTIKIWCLNTAKCLCTLKGHEYGVNFLIYLNNSNRLVSGSSDGTIKIWLGTSLIRTLVIHGWCSCLVATKYTNEIVTCTDDILIKIWDLNEKNGHKDIKCLKVLEGHQDSVNYMCLIENETRLVSCSDDRTIKIWLTTHHWSCLYTICDAHADWIVTLCYFGLNRKKFASGSCDHKIRVWNVETGECEKIIEGHTDWVRTLTLIEPNIEKGKLEEIENEKEETKLDDKKKKYPKDDCCIIC